MKWYRILIPVFLLITVGTLYTYDYQVPEPEWKTYSLENNTSGQFVKTASTEEKIHVFFMTSEDGGVSHYSSNSQNSLMRAFELFRSGRNWSEGTVENRSNSGRYLSVDSHGDQLYAIYQDSTIGTESVTLANYTEEEWLKERVANSGEDGINVGMYSNVAVDDEKTVVGYHAPAYGLTAEMKINEGWKEENLGENAGWFTDSATCPQKTVLAYVGRESFELRVSIYSDEEWNTSNTSEKAEAGIGLVMEECEHGIAFMDPDDNNLKFMKNGERQTIDSTGPSRLGITYREEYLLSYHKTGEGVHLARSENGLNWTTVPVDTTPTTGAYNDVAADYSGNIFVVYEKEDEILVSEYNEGTVSKLSTIVGMARTVLTSLSSIIAAALIFSVYRNREYLEKTFHIGSPK